MRTINRDCVVALVLSADGKILLGMKDPAGGGVYPDCWHLPGGGIEPGESQAEALAREVREEVGLDIAGAQVQLLDDTGTGEAEKTLKDTGERVLARMRFFIYQVDLPNPAGETSVRPGGDIVQFRWAGRNELRELKLTPPSVTLFTKLGWL